MKYIHHWNAFMFFIGSLSTEAALAVQRRECVVLYPNCTENRGQSCQRYEYCEAGSHYCFTAWSPNNASANGMISVWCNN